MMKIRTRDTVATPREPDKVILAFDEPLVVLIVGEPFLSVGFPLTTFLPSFF